MDLCHLNPLQCLNNGTCAMNYSLNMTYCLCDPCHVGKFCEEALIIQQQYDTTYVHLIVDIFALCISVLNNGMCLELFIKCKSIRYTNCGVYLIIYSILSLLASILLTADGVVSYDRSIFIGDTHARDTFHCVVGVVGYNASVFLCIWFSTAIQLERGLLLFRGASRNSTRRTSLIISTVLLVVVIGCSIPIVFYNCDWDHVPHLNVARVVLTAFHTAVPIIIYVIASILSLLGFSNRIRTYGMERRSYIVTFGRLLYSHYFIFIPPLVYFTCYIPFNAVLLFRKSGTNYYLCGISLSEYITKILLQTLTDIQFMITWLLFVCPSRIYRTEFYMNTWCGQWTAYISLLFRQHYCCWKKNSSRINQ